MIAFWCACCTPSQTSMNNSRRCCKRQLVLVAIPVDRDARHELHHEVGPALGCRAAVEDARDVRMIHHRQRLPLGFEPRDDGLCVHPRFDQLECDGAMNRLVLLGQPHLTHSAFAKKLNQAIRSDAALNLAGPIDV